MVYGMLWCMGCYGVWDAMVYGMLWCMGCYGVWDAMVYGMLWSMGCYGVWDSSQVVAYRNCLHANAIIIMDTYKKGKDVLVYVCVKLKLCGCYAPFIDAGLVVETTLGCTLIVFC